MRGLWLFKLQAAGRVVEAIVIAAGVILTVMTGDFTNVWRSVLPLVAGYAAFTLLGGVTLAGRLNFGKTDRSASKKLWSYSRWAMLGGLGGMALAYVDKVWVAKVLGTSILGVYSAYYLFSITVASYLISIVINVFFPIASSQVNREEWLIKINKWALRFAFPAFLAVAGFITLGIKLIFGAAYPLNLRLVLGFAAYSLLFSYYSVLWWLINSDGVRGIKFTARHGLVAAAGLYLILLVIGGGLTLPGLVGLLSGAVSYGIWAGNKWYRFSRGA